MKNIILSFTVLVFLVVIGSGCNGSQAPQVMGDGVTPETFVQTIVAMANSGQISAAYANSALLKVDSPQAYAGWSSENFVMYDSATKTDIVVNTYSFVNYPAGTLSVDSAAATDVVNFTRGVYDGTIGLKTVTPSIDTSGTTIYTGLGGDVYSQDDSTRDTDLQQSQLQQNSLLQRAGQISVSFQMDFHPALQIVMLSDTIQLVKAGQTQLTGDDQAAIMQRLQDIAGVSSDELAAATKSALQGDMTASNTMIDKISVNLGMPEGTLRDTILPQLTASLTH